VLADASNAPASLMWLEGPAWLAGQRGGPPRVLFSDTIGGRILSWSEKDRRRVGRRFLAARKANSSLF
jgi:sugar lactone lactonase YvrE